LSIISVTKKNFKNIFKKFKRPLEELQDKNGIELERRLIMWIFEEKLKMCYKQFVDGLQVFCLKNI